MHIPVGLRRTSNGEGSNESTDADARAVTMISTPGDGSCGIGSYTRDVRQALDGVETETLHIDQDRRTTAHFLHLALRAVSSDSDVIHVQHEYGLFRRSHSRYPGVMGLVFFSALALLTTLRPKTVVVTLHSVLKPAPSEAPRRVRHYLVVMHELIAFTADHLIFLSEQCEQRFREDVALREHEYSRLPHGVNASKATDVRQRDAKARFGFDPDDTVVMIPGFIRPPKGHDIFVEVANRLPEYEFFVAGGARSKGEDDAFAREIAATAGPTVTISGVLDDDAFPVALNAADLAVLPYRTVTQSGTYNWCVAQELPILASDEPYFERIRREWGAAETVDVADTDAVVRRIRALLESPDRLADLRRASRRYKRAHSFETVARLHRRIYVDPGPAATTDSGAERRTNWLYPRAACSAVPASTVESGARQ